MKKSFTFYCDIDDIAKAISHRGAETRYKNQKRLLRFIRKHFNSKNFLLKSFNFRKIRAHGGHPLRIRLEFVEPNAKEVNNLLILIQIYEFRQLFGRIYFGLPVQMPQDLEKLINYPIKTEVK
ncbi:MAG: hypothetical protein R3Y11_11730 [Pseudomonadota bacterium]